MRFWQKKLSSCIYWATLI